MSDLNKKPSGNKFSPNGTPSKRPPAAVFIWLLVLVMIVTLFIYKFTPSLSDTKELSQTDFERYLRNGWITTATVLPETEDVLQIEGTYERKNAEPVKKEEAKAKPEEKANADAAKDKSSKEEKAEKETAKAEKSSGTTDLSGESKTEDTPDELKKQKNYYRTRVIKTPAVMEGLKNVDVIILERDSWWKSLLGNVLIGIVIIGLIYFLFARQMRMAGKGASEFGKSRARMILPNENSKTFDDVAGCDEAKEETKEIVEYLKDPLKFKLLGGKIPRGALLTGPPGTGKTLMAKAVAGEAGVAFFAISGSDFVEMFVGVGASRVRDMFDQARKHAPCVIFIDEIDAVGRSRFSGIGGGHDEREQTLNAMLVEMDGLETQEGVIVLAATNRADVLDPALLRPGRFDRQIVIDYPDIAGRRKILDVHAKNIKLAPDVDLDSVARSTSGFSGADLANLINEAALLAARYNKQAADQHDLEEARDKVCFGRERKSRRIPERERRLTAWHEAGHTIVNIFCEHSVPLHKVTIIPRGQALGLTMMVPEEDRYSQSMLEMKDLMKVDMGGRAAEEIVFTDITSGASADISHATKVARAMVCSFGMSDKLGPIQYGERSDHIYLGRDITRSEAYSEETARIIDLEIKKLVDDAMDSARQILTEHRDMLDKLAEALLEKETLDAVQVYELLGLPQPKQDFIKEIPAEETVPTQTEPIPPESV
ncbi:MAG: ATP-dependent zinc metalloprotease FtsH [Lentisphaerae bacterium]|nr:ATP-dependent zinc metalloprotease FtsH [Lentisphaerota bacterium]